MQKIIGIAIVIAATAIASPANAQSFDPENGTANIAAAYASPKRFETRTVPEYLGVDAYAMSARRKDTRDGWGNADVTTGGGSPGYNEMLRNW
jgi:hypothetical protein